MTINRGGKRPGAGRPKGSPNKASAAKAAEIAASGLTPLEYMLQVLRNEELPRDARMDAAYKAAPTSIPSALRWTGGRHGAHRHHLHRAARASVIYEHRPPFEAFHRRKQRWAALVCHRRAGKTVACVADLVDWAIFGGKPDGRYAYIAPLYNQAKDVAWTYMKRMVADVPGVSINESELRLDFANGGRVRLYGADNPDRLRGLYLDGVVLDEYADMHPSMWGEVIRPALSDRKGWATFIGTPKGRNAFFKLYEDAKESDDWFHLMLRADESGLIDAEELEDARKTMTPEQFEQEYLCSFEAAIMGAYYGREMAEAERSGRLTSVPYDPSQPVFTVWDLGIADSTAIWFWQSAGSEIHVIDYYEANGEGIEHYAKVRASKPYTYADDWVPHDAKARELGTGRTRVETMLAHKLKPRIVPDHKIMDGINALRLLFPRMWFDAEKCRAGLEALRQYRTEYDEKKRAFKDHPRHDWTSHAADSARYLAMAYRELKPEPVKSADPPRGIMHATFDEMLKVHDRQIGAQRRL
jgi:phage terminase large subunit